MSSPVIWGPTGANNLQANLGFNNGSGPSILTGAVNPSVVATNAVQGSHYLNQSNSVTYIKQDNGTTTNWKPILTSQTSYAPTMSFATTATVFGGFSGGTYTTPANCSSILIKIVGAGGGGGPGGTAGTGAPGTSGTSSTFGSTILVANGGVGGGSGGAGAGAGGSVTSSISTAFLIAGARGNYGEFSGASSPFVYQPGGAGGASPFGGGGATFITTGYDGTGYGSGGSGGGLSPPVANVYAGGGGGSGGYAEAIIANPAASYSYTIGASGAGSGGALTVGGNGANGAILIYEYYSTPQSGTNGINRIVQSTAISIAAAAAVQTDYVYILTVPGITLTLPTAVSNLNTYTIKNTSGGTVFVNTTASQTIDGSSAPISITPPASPLQPSLDIISNGANWNII